MKSLHLIFLVLIALAGCSKTQTVVLISAEPMVRSAATSVRITVEGAPRNGDYEPKADKTLQVVDGTFPFEVSVKPDGDAEERVFRVTATALNAEGEVAQGRVVSGFVDGESRTARIVLWDICQGVTCDGLQTCGPSGLCVGATFLPESLPPFEESFLDGGQPDSWPDASIDAPTDDVSVDVMPPDAVVDADAMLDADASDVIRPNELVADYYPPSGHAVGGGSLSIFVKGTTEQLSQELELRWCDDTPNCPTDGAANATLVAVVIPGGFRFDFDPMAVAAQNEETIQWRTRGVSPQRSGYFDRVERGGSFAGTIPTGIYDGNIYVAGSTLTGVVRGIRLINFEGGARRELFYWDNKLQAIWENQIQREERGDFNWLVGGDFGGRGRADIIAAETTGGQRWSFERTAPAPILQTGTTHACVGDVDGDGLVELVVLSELAASSLKIDVFGGDNLTLERSASFRGTDVLHFGCREDLTGDGVADMLLQTGENKNVTLHLIPGQDSAVLLSKLVVADAVAVGHFGPGESSQLDAHHVVYWVDADKALCVWNVWGANDLCHSYLGVDLGPVVESGEEVELISPGSIGGFGDFDDLFLVRPGALTRANVFELRGRDLLRSQPVARPQNAPPNAPTNGYRPPQGWNSVATANNF